MNLFQKLSILLLICMVALFAGTVWISLQAIQSFVIQQSKNYAEDTTSSLGLSIQNHLSPHDPVGIDLILNSIFDSTYYSKIELDFFDPNIKDYSLKSSKNISNVPKWFEDLIQFEAPSATHTLRAGWKEVATLTVTAHQGYAIQSMWSFWKKLLLLFSLSIGGLFVLLLFSLRWLLKPLKQMEHQANAICDQEFIVSESIPGTLEFKSLTLAMNQMSLKLREQFQEQMLQFEEYRKTMNQDPLTGLANRRSFIATLEDRLRHPNPSCLCLLSLKGLKEYNDRMGYEKGNLLLKKIGQELQTQLDSSSEGIFRLDGPEFAILASGSGIHSLSDLANHVYSTYQVATREGDTHPWIDAGVGAITLEKGDQLSLILEKADRVTHESFLDPKRINLKLPDRVEEFISSKEWLEILEHAIATKSLLLYVQPVLDLQDSSRRQLEVFCRLEHESKLYTPKEFLGFAERHQACPKLDRAVIEILLQEWEQSSYNYTINLSLDSAMDPHFFPWLQDTLIHRKNFAQKLSFEMSEQAISKRPEAAAALSRLVQSCGSQFCIDGFGSGSMPFTHLNDIKPNRVKIYRSIIKDIDTESRNREQIKCLKEGLKILNIELYAEYVETREEFLALNQLGLNGLQGFYIGEPNEMNQLTWPNIPFSKSDST